MNIDFWEIKTPAVAKKQQGITKSIKWKSV